jgi:hypothetical protein
MIVLGHSIFLAQPVFPALLENLLRGGTGLFVFISGFFFHRVFYTRFDYVQFVAKKPGLGYSGIYAGWRNGVFQSFLSTRC